MKKGLMHSTLAIIIIVLISAAILMAFFWQFSGLFAETTDRGTCRASVELRGTQNLLGEAAKAGIPLRCKTDYFCLTMGGTCPEGYTKIKVNNEDEIKKQMAYYMYDCWWMLGEGKLNFFSRELKKEKYCVFCSQIAFDTEIQKKFPEIRGINSYLRNNAIPNKNMSYWQYFTNVPTLEDDTILSNGDTILSSEKYAITYSLLEKSYLSRVLSGGIAAGTTLIVVVPLAGTGIGIGAAAAGGILTANLATQIESWIDKHPFDYYSNLQLVTFRSTAIQEFGCSNIESIP